MEPHSGRKHVPKSGRAGNSRATRLLEQLIRLQLATGDELATFLGIPPKRFDKYLAGEKRLPLESQRRLAQLIAANVPQLAREALRLQLQCDAEELFRSKETQTHMIAPPSRFR